MLFTLEHILIVIVLVARKIVDREPEWVSIFLQRREYRKRPKPMQVGKLLRRITKHL